MDPQIKKYINDLVNDKMILVKNQLIKYIDDKMIADDSSSKQLMVLKKDISKQIRNIMEKEVQPQLDDVVNYVNFQTQDATELVDEYRTRVHQQVEANRKQKRLTNGDSESSKKYDYGRVAIFFQEE